MAELPEHHHFTRWWLKRFQYPTNDGNPNRVILFDRVLNTEVGSSMRYPQELEEAIGQLKMLRARDQERFDQYVFCDGHGDHNELPR